MGAYDSYDIEYHLTPNGWIKGREWYFGKMAGEVAPPSDRVLTILKSVRQGSEWSREAKTRKETWRSSTISDDYVTDLQSKFPRPE